MSTKTYLFHERSSIFPLIEGEDFEALVEDIRKFGQLDEGVLFKGKILDGRNRYRACKILKIPFKCKEYSEKMDPLDYIISQNLHRRHLNIAQRSEIGLLLLEEEEKKAKERQSKIAKIQAEMHRPEGSTKFEEISGKGHKDLLSQKISEIKKEMGEGRSREIIAPKVRISDRTLQKAKKIKKVAEKDPEIKEEWNRALKGDSTVGAVYKKVQDKEIIEKLPEDLKEKVTKEELGSKEIRKLVKTIKEIEETAPELKEELLKPETKITEEKLEEIIEVAKLPKDVRTEVVKREISIDEAKEVAEFPKEEQRKEIVKQIKQTKQAGKKLIEQKKDIVKGKRPALVKKIDLDMKFINAWKNTKLMDIPIKIRKGFLESYSETTRQECYKIVRSVVNYLIKEFSDEVKIIETKFI